MHARIYFLLVILTSVIIATFLEEKISTLSRENQVLRTSLKAQLANTSDDPVIGSPDLHSVGLEGSGRLRGSDETPEKTQEKIGIMEDHLKRYRHEAIGYQMMIDALKNEISIKDTELQDLRNTIDTYQSENRMFLESLRQKERDLSEAIILLNQRKEEAELEKKVEDLSRSLRIAEADACYARAQLTEVAANKIFFSPARKKEYLKEALEGYKKAHALGKLEAGGNITKLEKSLLPTLASVK